MRKSELLHGCYPGYVKEHLTCEAVLDAAAAPGLARGLRPTGALRAAGLAGALRGAALGLGAAGAALVGLLALLGLLAGLLLPGLVLAGLLERLLRGLPAPFFLTFLPLQAECFCHGLHSRPCHPQAGEQPPGRIAR